MYLLCLGWQRCGHGNLVQSVRAKLGAMGESGRNGGVFIFGDSQTIYTKNSRRHHIFCGRKFMRRRGGEGKNEFVVTDAEEGVSYDIYRHGEHYFPPSVCGTLFPDSQSSNLKRAPPK